MDLKQYDVRWMDVVEGKIQPPISNLSLKIKLSYIKMQLVMKKLTVEEAKQELILFCKDNWDSLEKDIQLIINSN